MATLFTYSPKWEQAGFWLKLCLTRTQSLTLMCRNLEVSPKFYPNDNNWKQTYAPPSQYIPSHNSQLCYVYMFSDNCTVIINVLLLYKIYVTKSLCNTLQRKRRRYSYKTFQDKRGLQYRCLCLEEDYNLKGRGKWYNRYYHCGNKLMEKVKLWLGGGGGLDFPKEFSWIV